jgi:hypothetical protein
MNNPTRKQTDAEPVSIEHILAVLRDTLPDIAKDLITTSHDLSDPLNQSFVESPDSPAEHSPRWHQYGILTHSEKFRVFMEADTPVLLEQWGLLDKAEATLSRKIDGISKADLLQVLALLHDLGKFTARTFEYKEGKLLARFVNHEAHSGAIIRSEEFKDTLHELGLSETQIDYIALCAEHHFDLGKARQIAIDNGGYSLTFARSEAFKSVAKDIIETSPDIALEIGLMFMADSLSKTEVASSADTDEGIELDREKLEQEIKAKNLDPQLINQALQQPVNIEIGRQYLQLWAAEQAA